ncbi:MAG: N-6 DNA methylase [Gammaproteobacteria bacterium]|nr:N-6 DNA methylase [Gammaproteobacteria bacterium]MDE0415240.1 N-6 DNA methylase [Gammaproteobacteria bacterium]
MNMKPEMGLGILVDAFRFQIDPGAFVSILSQLCVLDQLIQRDKEFRKVARNNTGSRQVLVGELLEAGMASLARQEVSNPSELINMDSPGWSLLPSGWINQVLELLHDSEISPERRGRWLLAQARSRLGRKLDFPREFLALVRELSRNAESVYLPFDAPALSILELTTSSQEINLRPQSEQAYKLLKRALFVARRQGTVQYRNPYSRRGIPDASLAVIIPPPGERMDRTLLQEVSHVYWTGKSLRLPEEFAVAAHVAEAGQHVLAFVPSGLLFRGGRSRTVREWLVDLMGLEYVIEFPARCLRLTPIGCALLSIRPKHSSKPDSVRLVAADSSKFIMKSSKSNQLSRGRELARATLTPSPGKHDEVADVKKALIRKNDYVLNPARYQTQDLDRLLEDSRVVRLGNLCHIIFPVATKDSREEPTTAYFEVLMSDFEPDGTVAHGSRERMLDVPWLGEPLKHELKPGDILLGVKGTIGKVAIVTEEADENLLAGQSMVILRLEDRDRVPDPVYLLRYLSQPAVGKFLNAMAGGSAIRFVRAKDIANLPVPIGSLEEQTRVRELHVQIVDAIAEAHDCMEEARRLNESAFRA